MTALKPLRPQEGKPLYRQARAGFILHGTTLTQWCALHKVHRTYAIQCLNGERDGPRARALRQRLLEAARAA